MATNESALPSLTRLFLGNWVYSPLPPGVTKIIQLEHGGVEVHYESGPNGGLALGRLTHIPAGVFPFLRTGVAKIHPRVGGTVSVDYQDGPAEHLNLRPIPAWAVPSLRPEVRVTNWVPLQHGGITVSYEDGSEQRLDQRGLTPTQHNIRVQSARNIANSPQSFEQQAKNRSLNNSSETLNSSSRPSLEYTDTPEPTQLSSPAIDQSIHLHTLMGLCLQQKSDASGKLIEHIDVAIKLNEMLVATHKDFHYALMHVIPRIDLTELRGMQNEAKDYLFRLRRMIANDSGTDVSKAGPNMRRWLKEDKGWLEKDYDNCHLLMRRMMQYTEIWRPHIIEDEGTGDSNDGPVDEDEFRRRVARECETSETRSEMEEPLRCPSTPHEELMEIEEEIQPPLFPTLAPMDHVDKRMSVKEGKNPTRRPMDAEQRTVKAGKRRRGYYDEDEEQPPFSGIFDLPSPSLETGSRLEEWLRGAKRARLERANSPFNSWQPPCPMPNPHTSQRQIGVN